MLESHPLRSIKAATKGISDIDRLWLGGLVFSVLAHKFKSYGSSVKATAQSKVGATKAQEVVSELDMFGFFDLVDRDSVLDALAAISGSLYDCWRAYRRNYFELA